MSETLEYIRATGDGGLVIQVSGGGVAEHFPRGLPAQTVANRLRYLADRLEHNVEGRVQPPRSES